MRFWLCKVARYAPVLIGKSRYASWGSFILYQDQVYGFVSICEDPHICRVSLFRSANLYTFNEVGEVLSDGLTAAPFIFDDKFYLIYVDRKRGNKVRIAVSRDIEGPYKDFATVATPELFGATEIDLGSNVYIRGPLVDVIVSNILPYPRNLWVLRISVNGGFVNTWRIWQSPGLPGPWHSLHNASLYKFDDYYVLLSASNDYTGSPYRGYIVGFYMDSLYNMDRAVKQIVIDASAQSPALLGRDAVLGADTPSLVLAKDRAILYFSIVDRSVGRPWDIYAAEFVPCNYAH
jgi:hypothetical protein